LQGLSIKAKQKSTEICSLAAVQHIRPEIKVFNTNTPDNPNISCRQQYLQPMHIIPPTGQQALMSGQYKNNGYKASMHVAKVDQ